MIYTVTFNPAVDYVMHFDSLNKGQINRSVNENFFIGGKGINVSLVLKELDVTSVNLGFVCGFTGELIKSTLLNLGIKYDFTELKEGFSRINVKLISHEETELNGKGPSISKSDFKRFLDKLSILSEEDFIIISGSLMPSVTKDLCIELLDKIKEKRAKLVVDTSKEFLKEAIAYKPFLIKPNKFELEDFFNKEFKTDADIIEHAKILNKMGVQNVLVTLGRDGAVLVSEKKGISFMPAPKGRVVNSVGAGDSTVAGFIAGLINSGDFDYALKLGISAGSATAFKEGLAKHKDIESIFKELRC